MIRDPVFCLLRMGWMEPVGLILSCLIDVSFFFLTFMLAFPSCFGPSLGQ